METLRKVWLQNFFHGPDGRVKWRTAEEGIPPSRNFLNSPIDPDCRYARKFTTSWVGYKVHLTETCEDDLPSVLTDVRTAPATVADGEATPLIHEALEKWDLLPETQFVDTGYLDAELLFESRERYGVDLFGPTRPARKWQAKEGTGFEAAAFSLDWEERVATCPEGKKSISWSPAIDNRYNRVVKIKFSSKDCMPCPSRDLCIRSTRRWKRRSITVRADGHQQALEASRPWKPAGLGSGQEAGERAGVRNCLCEKGRHRGNGLAGREGLRHQTIPVRGTREDATAPPVERRFTKLPAGGRVALGYGETQEQMFPVCQTDGAADGRLTNSPAVSRTRQSPGFMAGYEGSASGPRASGASVGEQDGPAARLGCDRAKHCMALRALHGFAFPTLVVPGGF